MVSSSDAQMMNFGIKKEHKPSSERAPFLCAPPAQLDDESQFTFHMRTSNVPPLALIALGICIFLRPRRREHPEPARRHVPFEPEERVELSDFILSELQPTPTASITLAHERRVLEAPWLRRDHPSERVLSLSRAALSADTLSHLRVLPRLGAVFCPVPGVASRALLSALLRAERAAGGSIAPFLTDFALRDRERLLTRPDVHRVLFVRHPLARALSVFYAGRRATDLNGPAYRAFLGHVHGHSLAPDERELQPLSLPFFL
eukprot:IDg16939t1